MPPVPPPVQRHRDSQLQQQHFGGRQQGLQPCNIGGIDIAIRPGGTGDGIVAALADHNRRNTRMGALIDGKSDNIHASGSQCQLQGLTKIIAADTTDKGGWETELGDRHRLICPLPPKGREKFVTH
ncbi:MAG: hypothetical protein HC838_04620 [Spirulinaceae cyanobacterium RM2_2_10]|nr:hypothetical protein [Spirulinaceae cyanobacterium RM2_2_10]